MKHLYIAEKPSVSQEFVKALGSVTTRRDGYVETDDAIFTWCLGHLVGLSYPEVYDPSLKKWQMDTLPFIPKEWKYEVIPSVSKQFQIVAGLLNRDDVDIIYVCTDSGREGEYIYRLVEQMAGVKGKERRRVWIDSQTEEEIKRGVAEAKDLSEYDNLADSAYLRAKEDYLMGINFSRALTLKYGRSISNYMKTEKNTVIAVGRVMTCVLGMVVDREREIRNFTKTPFYRVIANLFIPGTEDGIFEAEWKAVEGSKYQDSPFLYKENGFKTKERARELIDHMSVNDPVTFKLAGIEKKTENKQPPLLYNLAELQNDCSRFFKLSPDETLKHTQELYEKKLVTYPRTDARVLSSAVAKVIDKNLKGLTSLDDYGAFASEILSKGTYKDIGKKTRYTNDKMITDHYAIIPTGQGLGNLGSISQTTRNVYFAIVRRFLAIFYPAAVYRRASLTFEHAGTAEKVFSSFKVLANPGYMTVLESYKKSSAKAQDNAEDNKTDSSDKGDPSDEKCPPEMLTALKTMKKGDIFMLKDFTLKEGETKPPTRYNSGSMILAMENAGNLIEDEELRAQIKGSGIGTSATRAEILKKLVDKNYIALNNKTQIITPTLMGELIYEVVKASIKRMLDPQLTASWEKGLTMVAEGEIDENEYLVKLEAFIVGNTNIVRNSSDSGMLWSLFDEAAKAYKK